MVLSDYLVEPILSSLTPFRNIAFGELWEETKVAKKKKRKRKKRNGGLTRKHTLRTLNDKSKNRIRSI